MFSRRDEMDGPPPMRSPRGRERPEAAAEEVEAVVVAVAVAVEDEEQVVEVEHPDECQRIGMKIDTKIAMRIAMKMTTMSLYDEDAVAAEAE